MNINFRVSSFSETKDNIVTGMTTFSSFSSIISFIQRSYEYEETCNSNVRVNMLYHLCIGIVALITVLTPSNFRAERTQTKGNTTCNQTSELQVSSYSTHEFRLRYANVKSFAEPARYTYCDFSFWIQQVCKWTCGRWKGS